MRALAHRECASNVLGCGPDGKVIWHGTLEEFEADDDQMRGGCAPIDTTDAPTDW